MPKKQYPRKINIVLQGNLEERVLKVAPIVNMDIHLFVNQCVEGVVNALESDEINADIPVLKLGRAALGKSWLGSSVMMKICSLFAPKTEEVTRWHWTYLTEILSKHEGPLTEKIWELYWNEANQRNMLRVAREKELAKIKKPKEQGK
jgi:hypothetical protein